jgi:hypothetical protein
MKICTKCDESKPESEYFVKDRRAGRLFSWCKACERTAREIRKPRSIKPRRKSTRQREYQCAHCGKTFNAIHDPKKKQRFCSKKCSYKRVRARKEDRHCVCNICGKTFSVTHEQRKARICSEECRKAVRAQNAIKTTKRTERICQQCGKTFKCPPCRNSIFCSRACASLAQSGKGTKPLRTSSIRPCDYCGKPVRKFRSREYHKHTFCNKKCYHEWDSWYKSQPEQQRKHAERLVRMRISKTSKVEDSLARWFDDHDITYKRQVNLKYCSMDFMVGNAYIEVQGCYWHGCPQCYILQTPRQRKVMSRDKAKVTYCRRRNIPLYTIWEHDIRAGNYSALEPLLQYTSPNTIG